MKIVEKTFYEFNGYTFKSINDVKRMVEDQIGYIIDNFPGDFGERIKVYDWLIANKDTLAPLLSITYDQSDDVLHSDVINILDY